MTAAKSSSPAADRARRYRERQRADRSILRIEIDLFGVTDALIEAGLLTEAESRDQCAVCRAIGGIIERWKNSVTRDA